jgi:hypothetical protein
MKIYYLSNQNNFSVYNRDHLNYIINNNRNRLFSLSDDFFTGYIENENMCTVMSSPMMIDSVAPLILTSINVICLCYSDINWNVLGDFHKMCKSNNTNPIIILLHTSFNDELMNFLVLHKQTGMLWNKLELRKRLLNEPGNVHHHGLRISFDKVLDMNIEYELVNAIDDIPNIRR